MAGVVRSVRWSAALWELVDAARGSRSTGAWLRRLVEAELGPVEEESVPADPWFGEPREGGRMLSTEGRTRAFGGMDSGGRMTFGSGKPPGKSERSSGSSG